MKTLKSIFVATFIAFAWPVVISAQTFTDIDGNVYNSVTIGTQIWMKENLKVIHYRNGDLISNITITYPVPGSIVWDSLFTGARSYYNNDSIVNAPVYGALYNWYAVNDSRNLCPVGWYIPSDADWATLLSYLGGDSVAGGKLKETGTTHWQSPNAGATNSSGFTALPGGGIDISTPGRFSSISYDGLWWSSTEYDSTNAYERLIPCDHSAVYRYHVSKKDGNSVRCVKYIESSINDKGSNYDVRIYPNPAIDMVTIDLNFDQKTNTRIELFDVVGQRLELISDFGGNEDQITFNVGELPHGLYLIKVTDSEGRSVSKRLMK